MGAWGKLDISSWVGITVTVWGGTSVCDWGCFGVSVDHVPPLRLGTITALGSIPLFSRRSEDVLTGIGAAAAPTGCATRRESAPWIVANPGRDPVKHLRIKAKVHVILRGGKNSQQRD
jgi:hypothetical protein